MLTVRAALRVYKPPSWAVATAARPPHYRIHQQTAVDVTVGTTAGSSTGERERDPQGYARTRRSTHASSGVRQPSPLGDTGTVPLHDNWDEDDPEPDMNDPATVAASSRAARGVRIVKLIHLALLALGVGLLALTLLLRVG